ncbi:MAG: hypothetical protein B7Z26_05410 [Asticcacaulis sp. 32-58-5]|nr:MAG: hypothetical protein B7Z26_05410 [Asticcacaulis sp. 32-58-5]
MTVINRRSFMSLAGATVAVSAPAVASEPGTLDIPDAPEVTVTLPATVEQYFWGRFGLRPYTGDEYRYAADDDVPQNGAYRGVSWWWRDITIPASAKGKRVLLHIRGARLRAEVFLNEQLVGYSIMSELPIDCDLTAAMKPGQTNKLAIRITNPGGPAPSPPIWRWHSVNLLKRASRKLR